MIGRDRELAAKRFEAIAIEMETCEAIGRVRAAENAAAMNLDAIDRSIFVENFVNGWMGARLRTSAGEIRSALKYYFTPKRKR